MQLTEQLTQADQTNNRAEQAPEQASDIQQVFVRILKPTTDADRENCATLAKQASEHYTPAQLRLVAARIEMLAALPPELLTELQPQQARLSSRDVAYQLARGVLASSPNAFLLETPGPEEQLTRLREEGIDTLSSLEKKLEELKRTIGLEIQGLADRTKEGADEEQIARNLKVINDRRQDAELIQTDMQALGRRVTTLDLALVQNDTLHAQLSGRTAEANGILLRASQQYGAILASLNPQLAAEVQRAQQEATLSPAEAIIRGQQSGDAISTAVSAAQENAQAADVVDQVRAGQAIGFSRISTAEQFLGSRSVYDTKNTNVTATFRSCSFVTVTDLLNHRMTVALTPAAKQRIEALRGKPVLLKRVSSLTLESFGGGRSPSNFRFKGQNLADHTIDAEDIGTFEGEQVFDANHQPIDATTDPRFQVAAEQMNQQRSFRMNDYVPERPITSVSHLTMGPDRKPFDKRLVTITTSAGRTYSGVTIDTDALAIIQKPAPPGMTLVLKRTPRDIQLSAVETVTNGRSGTAYRRVLDVDRIRTTDLTYAKIDDDTLTTQSVTSADSTESQSVAELTRQREESGRDILRAMDSNEHFQKTIGSANQIGESLSHLQNILTKGNEGTKRQAFVDFARQEAEPMLQLLRDPGTKQEVDAALVELRKLKSANLGVALGGAEREIDERIKALEGFSTMLTNGQVLNVFETIMDKSKFDADTWARWLSTELPKILAAIAVATAFVVTVVMTCGTAAPLWAIAAAGAAGGIVGAELGAEGVRLGRHLLDDDVRSGRLAYSQRSRLGAYAEGQEVIDPITGRRVPMEFMRDVASPYLQEFAINFVTTYATVGLGSLAASRMSTLVQNSNFAQAFIQRNPVAMRVATYLSQIGDDAARAGDKTFLRQWLNESIDELKDEFIREKGMEVVLVQMDKRLGPAAGLALTLARGFKPLRVARTPSNTLGSFAVPNTTTLDEVKQIAEAQGYPQVSVSDQYVVATDHDGNTLELHPEQSTSTISAETPEANTNEPAASTPDDNAVEAIRDLIDQAKTNTEGRKALLNYLKQNEVDDSTRLEMAEALVGTLTEAQRAAIVAAHLAGSGNLVDGYSGNDLQTKYNILAEAGLTKAQIGLLMDTGICGRGDGRGMRLDDSDLVLSGDDEIQMNSDGRGRTSKPERPFEVGSITTINDIGQMPQFSRGASVNIPNQQGQPESGWKIERRELRCLVRGGNQETYVALNQIDQYASRGWKPIKIEPVCVVSKPNAVARCVSLDQMAAANPSAKNLDIRYSERFQNTSDTGEHPHLQPGVIISVRRSDGRVESGWNINRRLQVNVLTRGQNEFFVVPTDDIAKQRQLCGEGFQVVRTTPGCLVANAAGDQRICTIAELGVLNSTTKIPTINDSNSYPNLQAGAPVFVRRSSGAREAGWTVESREQCYVMRNAQGDPIVCPVGNEKLRRSYEQQGYAVRNIEPGCIVIQGDLRKVYTVTELGKIQLDNTTPVSEDEAHNRILNPHLAVGTEVNVPRSSGSVEPGWRILSREQYCIFIDPQTKEKLYILASNRPERESHERRGFRLSSIEPACFVGKNGLTKIISVSDLSRHNPQLRQRAAVPTISDDGRHPQLQPGKTVEILNSSGQMENDWNIRLRGLYCIFQHPTSGKISICPQADTRLQQEYENAGFALRAIEPGCTVEKNGITRDISLKALVELNPDFPENFAASALVTIQLPDKMPESGWRLYKQNPDGTIVVRKYDDQKGEWRLETITKAQLEAQNFSTAEFAVSGRQPFRVNEEVYVVRPGSEAPERGWRVFRTTDGRWKVQKPVPGTIKGEQLVLNLDSQYTAHIHEIEGKGAERNTMPKNKSLEFAQRMHQELEKNATLSSENFRTLFQGELRQQNVGNCYLIASFNSLRSSPYFESIIRTSVIMKDGGFGVKFPLGGSDPRQEVFVSWQDLEKQVVNNDQHHRTSLKPVAASVGWQVLEAAYIRLQVGTVDRRQIEGGYGHDALSNMMGLGAQSQVIVGSSYYASLEQAGQKAEVMQWLNSFHQGRDIATVNTIRRVAQNGERADASQYTVQAMGKPIKLYYNHAYSIENVNRFGTPPWVRIKNPHDTSEPITFTFDEFAAAFADTSSVSVNFDRLFPQRS